MAWRQLSDTTPRARKPHTCELCGLRIAPGVRHVALRGVCDDGPVTFRMHNQCRNAMETWDQLDWECVIDYASFRECCLVPHEVAEIQRENGVEG